MEIGSRQMVHGSQLFSDSYRKAFFKRINNFYFGYIHLYNKGIDTF